MRKVYGNAPIEYCALNSVPVVIKRRTEQKQTPVANTLSIGGQPTRIPIKAPTRGRSEVASYVCGFGLGVTAMSVGGGFRGSLLGCGFENSWIHWVHSLLLVSAAVFHASTTSSFGSQSV